MNNGRTELLVGLLGIVGLIAVGFLVLQYGKLGNKMRSGYRLVVDVPDASGIREGVPVRLGGIDIGYVPEAPRLKNDYSGMELPLLIFEEFKIPKNSLVTIGTNGLVGDRFVKITLPKKITGEFIDAGSAVSVGSPAGLTALQADAESVLTEVSATLAEINRTLKSMDRVFERADYLLGQENAQVLSTTLQNLSSSTEKINEASESLQPMFTSAMDSIKEIKSASSNFKEASDKLDPIFSSAETAFAEVEKAATTANKTIGGADATIASANRALNRMAGTVSRADPAIVHLEDVLLDMRATMARANGYADQFSRGNGLLAELWDNPDFRDDFVDLIDKTEKKGFVLYPREKECRTEERKTNFRHPKQ